MTSSHLLTMLSWVAKRFVGKHRGSRNRFQVTTFLKDKDTFPPLLFEFLSFTSSLSQHLLPIMLQDQQVTKYKWLAIG